MGNRYTCKQTFEEWCLSNNRQDILDLWDYDLNDALPSDIPAGTKRKYYFKCAKGMHESDLKRILTITDNPNHKVICKECDHHIDLTGQIFGELTVIGLDTESKSKQTKWLCKCSCGKIVSALESKLKGGLKLTCAGTRGHNPRNSFKDILGLTGSNIIRYLRRTGLYIKFRNMVIKKDSGKCLICGSDQNIEVHHIYPCASYPELMFDVSNGMCLCKEHHSANIVGGFHNIYGKLDTTPEQLEDYINLKRKELGHNDIFNVKEYMDSCEIKNICTYEEFEKICDDIRNGDMSMIVFK